MKTTIENLTRAGIRAGDRINWLEDRIDEIQKEANEAQNYYAKKLQDLNNSNAHALMVINSLQGDLNKAVLLLKEHGLLNKYYKQP